MRAVKLIVCAILWSLCISCGSAKKDFCFVPAIHIKSVRADKVPLTRLSMSLNDGANRPAFLRSSEDDFEKSVSRFARMIVGSYSIPNHHQQDIVGSLASFLLHPQASKSDKCSWTACEPPKKAMSPGDRKLFSAISRSCAPRNVGSPDDM
ncbi:hypothetical protein GUITHDRAFT_161474 [Guillardia theta CCMP2712]|uniref:Uncharacterized protein n=1 Tax=Guillardia theta (strain CCMP2712) TaxID=905079 RepID=L1JUQ9_GUITC|nr:hypothetical protein GUITHDRAFT_161474 [Guillardia theta CCMP2712]EKX51940.1 hypothetical protein GUITHDRAFT_161474 [Guillardia theta CCMP2712]|eukprot:XP_005838920.1 hypothetical protein GUITHDRAFT_161474 [Guillardia theta CCMP2712]